MVNPHTSLNLNQEFVNWIILIVTCRIPSSSRYFSARFKLMELTVLSVELFAQGSELTMTFLPKLRMKVNQTFNFTYLNINQELVNWIILIRHFCQIPSRSRYFPPRFKLMELTVLSVELLLKGTNRR